MLDVVMLAIGLGFFEALKGCRRSARPLALYSVSADIHCALIQFSDPVTLTATFEKKMCTGASSALL
jgi:hypothetical protein